MQLPAANGMWATAIMPKTGPDGGSVCGNQPRKNRNCRLTPRVLTHSFFIISMAFCLSLAQQTQVSCSSILEFVALWLLTSPACGALLCTPLPMVSPLCYPEALVCGPLHFVFHIVIPEPGGIIFFHASAVTLLCLTPHSPPSSSCKRSRGCQARRSRTCCLAPSATCNGSLDFTLYLRFGLAILHTCGMPFPISCERLRQQ